MKIGFFGLLTLIFITLKLMGYIAWSWWWVLSPLWLPFVAVVTIVMLTGGIGVLIIAASETFFKKKK